MNYIPNEQLYKSDNIVFDDSKVWTKLNLFNDLLEIDRASGNARVVPLPSEYDNLQLSHRCINKLDNTIYIIPFKARTILVYDIEKEQFDSLALPENAFRKTEKGGYTQSAIIGDNLVMFGYHLSVLIYNITSGNFTVIDDIKNRYPEDESIKMGLWSWVADGNTIYIHLVSTNTIVELNVQTGGTDSYTINGYETIDGIIEYKNGVFLSPYSHEDGKIQFIWWNKSGEVVDSFIVPSKSEGGVRSFSWMAVVGDYIYCISGSYSNTLKVNVNTREVREVQNVPSVSYEFMHEKNTELELNYYSYIQMYDRDYCDANGLMVTIQLWLGKLVTIDAKKNNVISKQIELDVASNNRLLYEQLKRKGIKRNSYNMAKEECVFAGLEGYVAFLTN
jgi:hypothetical protein